MKNHLKEGPMFNNQVQASLKTLEEKREALRKARYELADVMTVLLVERGALMEACPSWLKAKISKG